MIAATERDSNLGHAGMAYIATRYCKAPFFGYLSQSTTPRRYSRADEQHLDQAVGPTIGYRIHLPAHPKDDSRNLPLERATRTHAHHDRHLWNLCLLWQRSGRGDARKRKDGAARDGRTLE